MYLPLTNNPEESFAVSIFDIVYNFKQLWNESGFWTIDILNSDSSVLIYGVKIVTKINILKQYPQIPFGLLSDSNNDPGRNDLESFELLVTENV